MPARADRRRWRRSALPVLAQYAARLPYVAAIAVLLLGWYGWASSCPGRPVDAAYKAVQLFGLNFDYDAALCRRVTLPLHLARFLAVAVSFGLLASVVSRRSFALLRAAVRRLGVGGEPVFVIGYGRVGQAVAAAFAHDGRQVVAIDRLLSRADQQHAETEAVELHEADSDDPDVEGWPVRLRTAREVVIACARDDEGLAVAAQFAQRRRVRGQPPLRCWVHLRSSALVQRLREGVDLLGAGEGQTSAGAPRPFMLDEAAARDLFVRHPLALRARQSAHRQVHVVLYGFAREFSWVALQQVLLNGIMPAPSLRAPRITVVSDDAADAARRWNARHPDICVVTIDGRPRPDLSPAAGRHVAGHLDFVTADLAALTWESGTPLAAIGGAADEPDPFVRTRDAAPVNLHLFCLGDDRASLAAALSLRQWMVKGAVPAAATALYAVDNATDLAAVQPDWQQRFLATGDAACSVRYAPFLGGPLHRLARAMHGRYPGAVPYDRLPETLRASNVRAAYHFAHKLALLGWEEATPLVDGYGLDRGGLAALDALDAGTAGRFALLEHARWRQDRLIDGWREGARDDERRVRDQLAGSLHDYAERLGDAERAKDLLQLAAFSAQPIPPRGGLVRRRDAGWEGAPPRWHWYAEAGLTLAIDDPAWPPRAVDRVRVTIPPERAWRGGSDVNARRAARRAALAAFARDAAMPISLERLSCDDWNWRDDTLGRDVGCVALPPLVVGFAGPRDPRRLPDETALGDAIAGWMETVRPPDGTPVPLVTGAAPGADRLAIALWRARGYGPVLVLYPYGDDARPRHHEPAGDTIVLPPGADVHFRHAATDQPGWTGHAAVTRAILERASLLLAVLEDDRAAAADPDRPADGSTAATLAEARLRGTPVRRIDPVRC